ncbi:uncharacterized protein [Phaseolus vulgaris]|uniref:uncharacterized protein n=1 Tax=Phaseolus vulgaris TaxID=3885 RepID=UPI0035CC721A
MLYYGEDKDKEVCKKCNESRWKRRKKNKTIDGTMKKQKKVPAKVLRYFPLKPRLQRMFMSSKIAEHMQWHASGSTNDGILRHLRDSEAWKNFDSYSNEVFNMHAAILWTISDFPGLGTLSGWNTHTRLACPRCNFDTTPKKIQGKFCFMDHRRWLNARHKFRLARIHFDGSVENRNCPLTISGKNVLRQVENVNIIFGKEPKVEELGKRQHRDHQAIDGPLQWRKKSIFFELPYWVKKSKDNLKARKDLKDWGVRLDLWPDENNKYLPAIYTLTKENKHTFLTTLKNITVPDGYSSTISRCVDVKQCKLGGLKSHDSHVLMEQLLPLAMRKTLPKEVCYVLIDLCSFFRNLCSKVLKVDELNQLQNRVVLTLCHMEILFPPAFFTIMVHLIVHLVEDAKLGGPAQYRWMYPIERYLGKLKSYVRNKAQPEGSIAESYMAEESLTFCSRYLNEIEIVFNRIRRVNDEPDTIYHLVQALCFHLLENQLGLLLTSLYQQRKSYKHIVIY